MGRVPGRTRGGNQFQKSRGKFEESEALLFMTDLKGDGKTILIGHV